MKKLLPIFALLCSICFTVHAQKTSTWKGGTPGHDREWNCATNWKEGRIPNEFSNVVIPDVSTSTFSYPVIREGVVEIFSLECAPMASLTTLSNARIIVLDSTLANQAVQVDEGVVYSGSPKRYYTAQRR